MTPPGFGQAAPQAKPAAQDGEAAPGTPAGQALGTTGGPAASERVPPAPPAPDEAPIPIPQRVPPQEAGGGSYVGVCAVGAEPPRPRAGTWHLPFCTPGISEPRWNQE